MVLTCLGKLYGDGDWFDIVRDNCMWNFVCQKLIKVGFNQEILGDLLYLGFWILFIVCGMVFRFNDGVM